MNVQKIKFEIEKIYEHQKLLKRLKISVSNAHNVYLAESQVSIDNDPCIPGWEREEKDYYYLRVETASIVFSDAGLLFPPDDIFCAYSDDADENYLIFPYKVLWSAIEILSDIDFFVAILSLIANREEYRELGKFYAERVTRLVRDSGFEEIYNIALNSNTVFVAMSFDEKMMCIRFPIQAAVKAHGYSPIIIDQKPHNNQIVPELYYEINKSTFVIADLTGQRNGVYYEAGYADALNKTVIYTCDKKERRKVHFDVAQKNIILWNTPQDLYEQLFKRIAATCR